MEEKRMAGMDFLQVKKEIEKQAQGHCKAVVPPVQMAEFEGLSGKEFLEKAYCRLLGRMPGQGEKEQLYLAFYSGNLSKTELLEGLAASEECAAFGVDVSQVRRACRERKEKQEGLSFFRQVGRAGRLLVYLFCHRNAWRRLERIQEIWEQEDAE
jgi:hypothetical protein